MLPKYFMDGDTLMVELRCDQSSVVTRPATKDETADYEERVEYLAAQPEAADEPSDDPEDGTPMPTKKTNK